jgi:hypothetical protein
VSRITLHFVTRHIWRHVVPRKCIDVSEKPASPVINALLIHLVFREDIALC